MIVSKWRTLWVQSFLILLLLILTLSIDVAPVQAATIQVTTFGDEDTYNSFCSLQEAIVAANSDNPSGYNGCTAGSGADTITLPAGTYTITSRLPAITSEISIIGASAESTIIQADSCNPVEETCTHQHRIFWVSSTGDLTLKNLTVQHGNGILSANGGAMINQGSLTIENSIIKDNHGDSNVGAIVNTIGGLLTVTDSTFSGNKTKSGGTGGAIHNESSTIIKSSTFYENSAGFGGGAISNDDGDLTIINSTISSNSADTNGGGIYNRSALLLINCTLNNNTVGANGTGLYNQGSFDIINTIIASSITKSDCYDIGTINTNKNNLIEDGTCDPDYSGDPLLVTLADNGGETKTHALGSESTAIDNGEEFYCPEFDQRGVGRPQGERCDIGAFEFYPAVADMMGSPREGIAPLEVTFTNQSTGDYDTCLWDFGDGSTSIDCEPSPHTYKAAGTYTVSLTVNGLGGEDTKTRVDYIKVTAYENYLPLISRN